MTSKNSFFKLLKEDLRQRLWSIILAMIVIILPITIVVLLEISDVQDRTAAHFILNMESAFEYENFWYYLVAMVGAFICAGCSFSYLFSKKKVDFFHGLPVSRTEQFAVRYISGVLVYLVPNLLFLLLNAIILMFAGVFSRHLAVVMLVGLLYHLMGFLIMYSAISICIFLVGNLFVWFAVMFWQFAYAPVAVFLYRGMQQSFYKTYAYQRDSFFELMNPFRHLSPFYYYGVWMQEAGNRMEISGGSLIFQTLLYIVVLVALCYVLYRIRPSEGAGKAIVFGWAKPLIRISSELLIGVGMAYLFYEMAKGHRGNAGWIVFGGALGVVLCHMFIESVLHYDVRKCFADKISMAVVAVVAVVFTLGMRYDVTGYDRYLPKQKKIVSVELFSPDVEYDRVLSGEKYSDTLILKDVGAIYPFLQECKNSNLRDEDFEYDYGQSCTVWFGLKLKNGTTVYRNYTIPIMLFETHYGTLFHSAEYKAEYLKGLKDLAAKPEQLRAAVFSVEEHTMTYSNALLPADKKELLDSLIAGYERMDWQTRYYTAPRFLIRLEVDYETADRNYTRSRSYTLPVYDCYTETIAFAKRKGFSGLEMRDWSKVESVTVIDVRAAYGVSYPDTVEYSGFYKEYNQTIYTDYNEEKITVKREDWERLYELCIWEGFDRCSFMEYNCMEYCYVSIVVNTDEYGNFEVNNYRIKKGADLSFLKD